MKREEGTTGSFFFLPPRERHRPAGIAGTLVPQETEKGLRQKNKEAQRWPGAESFLAGSERAGCPSLLSDGMSAGVLLLACDARCCSRPSRRRREPGIAAADLAPVRQRPQEAFLFAAAVARRRSFTGRCRESMSHFRPPWEVIFVDFCPRCSGSGHCSSEATPAHAGMTPETTRLAAWKPPGFARFLITASYEQDGVKRCCGATEIARRVLSHPAPQAASLHRVPGPCRVCASGSGGGVRYCVRSESPMHAGAPFGTATARLDLSGDPTGNKIRWLHLGIPAVVVSWAPEYLPAARTPPDAFSIPARNDRRKLHRHRRVRSRRGPSDSAARSPFGAGNPDSRGGVL